MNISNPRKFATIFGSSAPKEESFEYKSAYKIGFHLAKLGYTLKTGGYYGTMEAASRGALDGGIKAIGIPFAGFDPKKPNIYAEPQKSSTLFERMQNLIHNSELIIVLPGGLGTLSELSTAWTMIQTGLLDPKPSVYCIGRKWKDFALNMLESLKVTEEDIGLLEFVDSVEEFLKIFNNS